MKEYCSLCAAWCIACFSICCSVYLNEGLNLENCTLCWIQRMCMYPLAIILGMAVYNSCYTIIPYIIPQICIGCCAACYQVAMQANLFPDFLSVCEGANCLDSFELGMEFVSLPVLSICAFCCMMGCLFYAWRQSLDSQPVYIKIK